MCVIKHNCSFSEMKSILDNGGYAVLSNGNVLFKQIPASIGKEYILTLKSVPSLVKKIMLEKIELGLAQEVQYCNQYVSMNDKLKITYYTFSGDDINRSDWYVIAP